MDFLFLNRQTDEPECALQTHTGGNIAGNRTVPMLPLEGKASSPEDSDSGESSRSSVCERSADSSFRDDLLALLASRSMVAPLGHRALSEPHREGRELWAKTALWIEDQNSGADYGAEHSDDPNVVDCRLPVNDDDESTEPVAAVFLEPADDERLIAINTDKALVEDRTTVEPQTEDIPSDGKDVPSEITRETSGDDECDASSPKPVKDYDPLTLSNGPFRLLSRQPGRFGPVGVENESGKSADGQADEAVVRNPVVDAGDGAGDADADKTQASDVAPALPDLGRSGAVEVENESNKAADVRTGDSATRNPVVDAGDGAGDADADKTQASDVSPESPTESTGSGNHDAAMFISEAVENDSLSIPREEIREEIVEHLPSMDTASLSNSAGLAEESEDIDHMSPSGNPDIDRINLDSQTVATLKPEADAISVGDIEADKVVGTLNAPPVTSSRDDRHAAERPASNPAGNQFAVAAESPAVAGGQLLFDDSGMAEHSEDSDQHPREHAWQGGRHSDPFEEVRASTVPRVTEAAEPFADAVSRVDANFQDASGMESASGRVEYPGPTPLERAVTAADLAERLDRLVLSAAGSDGGRLRMELSPASLGRMTMQCGQSDQGLNVDIRVADPAIRSFLLTQEQGVRDALESQGMTLGKFSVSCDQDGGQSSGNFQSQFDDNTARRNAVPSQRHVNREPLPDRTVLPPGQRNRWVA